MNQDQFILMNQDKSIQLRAERVAFFIQGEIIEAYNEQKNEVYYLFFYQTHYLTACKAKRLRRNSYIAHAFKDGVVFEAPHPIINKLLPSDIPYKITTLKPFVKKLERLYSTYERALILTFFESFYPKKVLFHEISSIFYEYRRNGQMFLAYRIVRILNDFAPNHSLVKELMSELMFNKYAELYNRVSAKLLEKDPIYAEKMLFAQKEEPQQFQQLIQCYHKESRSLELIVLYVDKLTATPSNELYRPFLKLLHQAFNEHETIEILAQISTHIPTFLPLKQDLFHSYVKAHNMREVFYLVNQQEFHLNKSESRTFGNLLEDLDFEDEFIQPEMLRSLIKTVMKFFPDRVEGFMFKSVVSLLNTYELAFVKEWLAPFKDSLSHLQLFDKVEIMEKLNDDLDYMQTLGELYVEFKQLDKAIECFCWEMELKPNDTKPLQWLAKIYQEKGMGQEAEAFRQLCLNLQNRA